MNTKECIGNLKQISLTGVRAIIITGLLITAPRTFLELKQTLINMNILEENSSDDILRIDLNSIKAVGCEITRASRSTNYKYIITKHPFTVNINHDDCKLLKRIYDKIKNGLGIQTLIMYDNLFKKLASYIYNDELREELLGISSLKRYDSKMIFALNDDCNNHRVLELIYQKPTSNSPEKKELLADKLVFNNDKIYLYGYYTETKRTVVLNCKNIQSILSRKLSPVNLKPDCIKVKFYLSDNESVILTEEESLEEIKDGGCNVVGQYFNEFLAMQRILSLGTKCTVIEPLAFRNKVISTLKEMRKIYE